MDNEFGSDLIQGIQRYLNKLNEEKFYGVIELQFQCGELVLLRKQESIKPSVLLIVERRRVDL